MVACADVGNDTERIYWDELFEEVVFLWIEIIHYYQYRNDPHNWTPKPASPKTSMSPQQTTITIDGKETTIDASPEEIISSMMDQVDYNEMLDFYGDPELR